jgi:hypothetical protein
MIKEQYKIPLAMLYEQKRAIKIKIKKTGGVESANDKKPVLGLKKPMLAAPK